MRNRWNPGKGDQFEIKERNGEIIAERDVGVMAYHFADGFALTFFILIMFWPRFYWIRIITVSLTRDHASLCIFFH